MTTTESTENSGFGVAKDTEMMCAVTKQRISAALFCGCFSPPNCDMINDMLTYIIGFLAAVFGLLAMMVTVKIIKANRATREKRRIEQERMREQQRIEQKEREKEQGRKKIEEYKEFSSLSTMLSDSQLMMSTLSDLVESAATHIGKAEQEFLERAFAPFWDEVEYATNQLGAYHDRVTQITNNAKEYTARQASLSVVIPEFVVTEDGLPDARPVAARLSEIVRQGQKDFQFATIYEQRKTNQLLYAGFGTLATGIERMQNSITDALENLSHSLGSQLDDLVSSSQSQAKLMRKLNSQFARNARAQREFEMQALAEGKKQSALMEKLNEQTAGDMVERREAEKISSEEREK